MQSKTSPSVAENNLPKEWDANKEFTGVLRAIKIETDGIPPFVQNLHLPLPL